MNMWILLFPVIFLAFPLSACSDKGPRENPAASGSQQAVPAAATQTMTEEGQSKKRVIVAFGDSLTSGSGVRKDEAYPSLLQRRLDNLGYPYRVVNAGISGDTTAGGLRRVQGIIRSKPDLVLLELGVNDGLRGHPLNGIEHNLQSILDQFQAGGIRVVLLGMRLPPNYGEDYTSGFQQIFERLSKKYRVTFVPFVLEGVAAKPDLNQGDGVHPNAAGYQIIEENLWPVIMPLLHKSPDS